MALRQRVEKLEEEKGSVWWTAAGSTPDGAETVGWDDQKGTRGVGSLGDHVGIGRSDSRDVGDSIQYQQGFEKGYIAAKEMLDAQNRAVSPLYSTHDNPQFVAPCSTPQNSPPSVPIGRTFHNPSPPSVRSLLEEHVELRERTPSPNPDRYKVFKCATTPQGTPVPPGAPPGEPPLPNRPPPKMPLYQPSSLEANPVPEAIAARPCLGWALPVVDAGVLQGPSGSAVPGGDTGGSRGGLGSGRSWVNWGKG